MVPEAAGAATGDFFETFNPTDFPPLTDSYRGLIRDHAATFAALVDLVTDPRARPLVFHRTAGKDRTGVGAALLLSILGVSWDDIEDDYMLSKVLLADRADEIIDTWTARLQGRNMQLQQDGRKQLEQLLMVDSNYLAAARNEMVRLNGSVQTYIREYVSIGSSTHQTLRRKLQA